MNLDTILVVLACICFALDAFVLSGGITTRVNLTALGLLLWALGGLV